MFFLKMEKYKVKIGKAFMDDRKHRLQLIQYCSMQYYCILCQLLVSVTCITLVFKFKTFICPSQLIFLMDVYDN